MGIVFPQVMATPALGASTGVVMVSAGDKRVAVKEKVRAVKRMSHTEEMFSEMNI